MLDLGLFIIATILNLLFLMRPGSVIEGSRCILNWSSSL